MTLRARLMKAAALVIAAVSPVFEAGLALTGAAATTVAIVATAVTGVDPSVLLGHFPGQFQAAQMLSTDTGLVLHLTTISDTGLLLRTLTFMLLEIFLTGRKGEGTADDDADKTRVKQTSMSL